MQNKNNIRYATVDTYDNDEDRIEFIAREVFAEEFQKYFKCAILMKFNSFLRISWKFKQRIYI